MPTVRLANAQIAALAARSDADQTAGVMERFSLEYSKLLPKERDGVASLKIARITRALYEAHQDIKTARQALVEGYTERWPVSGERWVELESVGVREPGVSGDPTPAMISDGNGGFMRADNRINLINANEFLEKERALFKSTSDLVVPMLTAKEAALPIPPDLLADLLVFVESEDVRTDHTGR